MTRTLQTGGKRFQVAPLRGPNGLGLEIDGETVALDLRELGEGEHLLILNGARHRVWIASKGDTTFVQVAGEVFAVEHIDARGGGAGEGAGADTVRAPMPGTVVSVAAAPGDAVAKGQTLMVIESMKLQTAITAWRDGRVAELHLAEGATFERDAPLVTLETEAGEE